MMRLLFIDDEPKYVESVTGILKESLDVEIVLVQTVRQAIHELSETKFDLVVTDIFIPLGKNVREYVGPRARKYEENLKHLGGLAVLDFLDKMTSPPKILAHTACTDYALLEVLGEHVIGSVPKPAPVEVLLREIIQALKPPRNWTL